MPTGKAGAVAATEEAEESLGKAPHSERMTGVCSRCRSPWVSAGWEEMIVCVLAANTEKIDRAVEVASNPWYVANSAGCPLEEEAGEYCRRTLKATRDRCMSAAQAEQNEGDVK